MRWLIDALVLLVTYRAPEPKPPSRTLEHHSPTCAGLWLHDWNKGVLVCIRCTAEAEDSPANMAAANWLRYSEQVLHRIEDEANREAA